MYPAAASELREPGSLWFPDRPAGSAVDDMPFDHLVVVMMENHSFDNLLGDLGRRRRDVDALSFAGGQPTNFNPGWNEREPNVFSFPLRTTAQSRDVLQSWRATREQVNGGAMDGFVKSVSASAPMGYYTAEALPFAYTLASTFTLANRWFCSVPGPTYPNRRFLLAGTAFGGTTSNPVTLLDDPPPGGTILDRLSDHDVSWSNYFTDIPMSAVIPATVLTHHANLHPIEEFFHDCETGALPAVSFVDPGMGVLASLAKAVAGLPPEIKELLRLVGVNLENAPPSETEEDPADMYFGERWAWEVVSAILRSPAWPRTLLIYTYDEHGGYYDHVPPVPAIVPDGIPPSLPPGEPGAYDRYGPRVPAVVVSPYSRPGGVSNVVCDHTSILATIERKWNLPALTRRDANAETVMDFLAPAPALLAAPVIEPPPEQGPSGPVKQ